LQSPPGVGSIDGKPIRKRILSCYTAFLAKKCQQPRFRMAKPQGGKASLGGLVPASGKLADSLMDIFIYKKAATCLLRATNPRESTAGF